MEQNQYKETILLTDANYLDATARGLKVFLEHKMGRQLPIADLATWIVNAVMPIVWQRTEDAANHDFSKQETQVVFVCKKGKTTLHNITPGNMLKEVDGMAFTEELCGEFLMSVVEEEPIVEDEPLMVQSLEMLLTSKVVKRIIVLPDPEQSLDAIQKMAEEEKEKDIEILSMEADAEQGEVSVLGMSLFYALGLTPTDLQS